MRKYFTLFFGLIGMLGFSACETTNIYPNTSQSFIYTVNMDQWIDHESWFYHTLTLPELTDYYLKQGDVSVSISFDNEASYDILPSTFEGIAYSVRYSAGEVTIYGEDPLADENILIVLPNQQAIVKVILTETDYVE